jgi:hypothetical protein
VLKYFARARLLRHWRAWTCALQHSVSQLHEQGGGGACEQCNQSVAAAQGQDREEEVEEEAEPVRDPKAVHRDTQAAQQQAKVIGHANMCIAVDEMFISHSSLHTSSRPSREPRTSSSSMHQLGGLQPYAWPRQRQPRHHHQHHAHILQPTTSRIGTCEQCVSQNVSHQYVSQYVPSAPAHPKRFDSSLVFGRARDSGHVVIARQETTMTPNGSIKQVSTANRHTF